MGEPRDFSDDSEDSTDELMDNNEKPEKQLMRDTDRAVIGGVCAGIAAYFNINPLWVRLIAIVSPFVTFGTMVLVYPRDVGVNAASKNRVGQITNAREASNFGCA